MKLFKYILFFTLILFSCENKKDISNDILFLKYERDSLISLNYSYDKLIINKKNEIKSINENLKESRVLKSGQIPKYIVNIEIKQSRYSLSISDHIKDEMNAIEISVPVDRDFYYSVNKGSVLNDSFRGGSFWMKGSLSSWDIKVKDKYIN